MKTMIKESWKLNKAKNFEFFGKHGDKGWSLGAGRYTPKHWIGSHPNMKPCDVSVIEQYSLYRVVIRY